jgi:hypothetical protein
MSNFDMLTIETTCEEVCKELTWTADVKLFYQMSRNGNFVKE